MTHLFFDASLAVTVSVDFVKECANDKFLLPSPVQAHAHSRTRPHTVNKAETSNKRINMQRHSMCLAFVVTMHLIRCGSQTLLMHSDLMSDWITCRSGGTSHARRPCGQSRKVPSAQSRSSPLAASTPVNMILTPVTQSTELSRRFEKSLM